MRPLVPTLVRFGAGRFAEAPAAAAALGRRALVVTSRRAMERLGRTAELLRGLRDEGVATEVFCDYRLSPTTDDVDRGAGRARAFRADVVIGLGGGSAIDCAKAVAAIAPGTRPAADYLYGRAAPGDGTLPILAIPTTSGSGSETNRSAILSDAALPFKDGIRGDPLFPRCAVVDPSLMQSLDRTTTSVTGFDALAHAIESFVSPRARPDADARALDAAEAIVRWLPVALEEPANPEARTALARAATTMGFNLSTVGTCLPHRADKPICALHPGIAHGQSLALVYPAWARRIGHANQARFERLAAILDPATGGAAGFPAAVDSLLRRIGLTRRAAEFGLTGADVPTLAANVAGDTTVDPVPAARDELPAFFEEVVGG